MKTGGKKKVKKTRFKEIWVSTDGKEWIFFLHCISSLVDDTIKKWEDEGYNVKAVDPNDISFDELRKKLNVIPHNI